MELVQFILIAALGAVAQEAIHWYELRKKFSSKRVAQLFSSPIYWCITLFVIVITPVCCWVLFFTEEYSRQLPFFAGAAFPLILKKTVSAFAEQNTSNLGGSTIRDYFQLHSFM